MDMIYSIGNNMAVRSREVEISSDTDSWSVRLLTDD